MKTIKMLAMAIIIAGMFHANAAKGQDADTLITKDWVKEFDYGTSLYGVWHSKTDKYVFTMSEGLRIFYFLNPVNGEVINQLECPAILDTVKQIDGSTIINCQNYGNLSFISNDECFLLQSKDRKTIHCYNTKDFSIKYSLESIDKEKIGYFDVSTNEKYLVAKVGGKGVKVWDLETKKIISSYSFPTYPDEISCSVFTPQFEPFSERIFIKGSSRVKTGTSAKPPYYHSEVYLTSYLANTNLDSVGVFKVSTIDDSVKANYENPTWSKDGKYFAVVGEKILDIVPGKYISRTGFLIIFDAKTRKEIRRFDIGQPGVIRNITFTKDGEYIVVAVGMSTNLCKVFRIKDGKNTLNYEIGTADGVSIDKAETSIIVSVSNLVFKYPFFTTKPADFGYFDNGWIRYPNPIRGGGGPISIRLTAEQEVPSSTELKIIFKNEKGEEIEVTKDVISGSGKKYNELNTSNVPEGEYTIIILIGGKEFFRGKIRVVRTTSASKDNPDNEILVYPNPTQREVMIKFKQAEPGQTSIIISNEKGAIENKRIDFYRESGWNSLKIDISDLPNGMYFITVTSGKQNFSHKFMIER